MVSPYFKVILLGSKIEITFLIGIITRSGGEAIFKVPCISVESGPLFAMVINDVPKFGDTGGL